MEPLVRRHDVLGKWLDLLVSRWENLLGYAKLGILLLATLYSSNYIRRLKTNTSLINHHIKRTIMHDQDGISSEAKDFFNFTFPFFQASSYFFFSSSLFLARHIRSRDPLGNKITRTIHYSRCARHTIIM